MMDTCRNKLKGWGLWVEAMEITEVEIMSSEVSRNLQCEFRETQNLHATQNKMETDHDVSTNQKQVDFDRSKRQIDTDEKTRSDNLTRTLENTKRDLERYKKDCKNNTTHKRIKMDEAFAELRRKNESAKQELKSDFAVTKQRADAYVV